MLNQSNPTSNAERRRYHKTGSLIVVGLVLCVAGIGWFGGGQESKHVNVGISDLVMNKEAARSKSTSSRAVATSSVVERRDAEDVWGEKDEWKFRAAISAKAKQANEEQFVDRLVNEWKLSRTYTKARVSKVGVDFFGDVGRFFRTKYYYPRRNQHVGPLGGGGGHAFGGWARGLKIRSISVRSGALVDRIEVVYTNGERIAGGGNGGNPHSLTLGDNDCIGQVTVGAGALVDSVRFKRTSGSHHDYGHWGGSGGEFHIMTGIHSCLRGISGRAGALVDQLTFYWD